MNELEKFKREINIAEFAMLYGYKLDKKKSSRNSKVLQHENGDKIVVSRSANGFYVYFNVTDNNDNGTIIDFVQKRTGKNLGHIRKELRAYLKEGYKHVPRRVKIKKSEADTQKILRIWERIEEIYENKASFWSWRGIDTWDKIIEKGRAKIGKDGVIYFPMYSVDGLCGIERIDVKKREKRVIQGSRKGLWSFSYDVGKYTEADLIVVTESPLDALSWYKLNRNTDSFADKFILLVATMGALGEDAKLALRELARRAETKEWIIATDADKAGDKLAETIKQEVKSANREIELYRHKPETRKDWNEELQKALKVIERSTTTLSL